MVWRLHKKLQGRKGNPAEDQDLYPILVVGSHQLFGYFHAEHSNRSDSFGRNSDWSEHTYCDVANSPSDVDAFAQFERTSYWACDLQDRSLSHKSMKCISEEEI